MKRIKQHCLKLPLNFLKLILLYKLKNVKFIKNFKNPFILLIKYGIITMYKFSEVIKI